MLPEVVKSGDAKLAKILVSHGQVRISERNTALDLAVQLGHDEIAQILREKNSSI